MRTHTALNTTTIIPERRLPKIDEIKPMSELMTAAPLVLAMNIGAACSVAVGPKTRAKRAMFVGKIAELPNPAIAAPMIANESLVTRIKAPVRRITEQENRRTFSGTRLEMIAAAPRPRT